MPDEPQCKKQAAGAPAWIMTFADLMSLLMCFFVLLLSFSEMDVAKYKELAGSLKFAFGVQREIKAKEPPKGINVVAREFSPGRPEPTPLNVVRQMTTKDMNINTDLGRERRGPKSSPKEAADPTHEKTGKLEKGEGQARGLTPPQKEALEKAKHAAAARLDEKMKALGEGGSGAGSADDASLTATVKAREAEKRRGQLEDSARLISEALAREIQDGSVDVDIEDKKIIIRVREKASFDSGLADLKGAFRPILGRVARILEGSDGRIIVAGHTDNLPIDTERFRSNWELSSARAVSVVHEMMNASKIPADRFVVEGFGDTRPLVDNNSAANRAINRRVEIVLQQGEDDEAPGTLPDDAAGAAGAGGAGPSDPAQAPAKTDAAAAGVRP